jgi:hypothetical protein
VLLAVLGTVSASCAQMSCNDGLVTLAGYIPLIGVGVVFLAAVALGVVRGGRDSSTWWVPFLGIAYTVVVFFTGWAMLAVATHLGLSQFFGPVR